VLLSLVNEARLFPMGRGHRHTVMMGQIEYPKQEVS